MEFTGGERNGDRPLPIAKHRRSFGTEAGPEATNLKCRTMGWNPAVSDPHKTESDAPKSRPGLPICLR